MDLPTPQLKEAVKHGTDGRSHEDTYPISTPTPFGKRVRGLNVEDMFRGNVKEHIFTLLPGEEQVGELTIRHQQLFIFKSGVTRLTLTTQRLLYTATRVFSPIYWMLLALFPPLIFYYVVRLQHNRNVAIPLGSIDTVEKRYRPQWIWFILAVLVVNFIAGLCVLVIGSIFKGAKDSSGVELFVEYIVFALAGPVVLILLLATRIVGFNVRTGGSNHISVRFSPGDIGVSEEEFDTFFQKVHDQMERARKAQS